MRTLSVLAIGLGLALVGCGGGSWVVVKQATPNPLLAQKAFSVEPIVFEGMKIGDPGTLTEAEWIAKKKPEEQAKFTADLTKSKERLIAKFNEALIKRAGNKGQQVAVGAQPSTFVIKVQVIDLEPGYNVFVSQAPAMVKLAVSISDDKGAELDNITVKADASGDDMADRFGQVGGELGATVASYLGSRTAK